MWLTLLYLFCGIALLTLGAAFLIRGGAALALRMGISALVVGLTVISFGTSSPELVVSFKAAWSHDGSIALGNVVGSNICNIALVLGLSALIRPIRVHSQVVRLEVPIMILVTVMALLLLWNGQLVRWEGGALLAGLGLYVSYSVMASRRKPMDASLEQELPGRKLGLGMAAILVALGVAMLVPGSHLFVSSAVRIAEAFGLSPVVIGLTVVAVGTSLPEIATSVVASLRGEGDMALGNAIGSNIFNILLILGITAVCFGLDASALSRVDMGVMLAFALVSLPLLRTDFLLTRREGGVLVLGYLLYMYYLVQAAT